MSGIIEQTVLYHTQLQYARMLSLAQQLQRAPMARRHSLAEAVLAAQLEMNNNVGATSDPHAIQAWHAIWEHGN